MNERLTFTHMIKDELSQKEVSVSCAKSIIASFIKLNGNIILSKNNTRLVLRTETSSTAKYLYKLLKIYYI